MSKGARLKAGRGEGKDTGKELSFVLISVLSLLSFRNLRPAA
jgi:hypothetical protein